jgi:hypothetical protein
MTKRRPTLSVAVGSLSARSGKGNADRHGHKAARNAPLIVGLVPNQSEAKRP